MPAQTRMMAAIHSVPTPGMPFMPMMLIADTLVHAIMVVVIIGIGGNGQGSEYRNGCGNNNQ